MKPSERIKQIARSMVANHPILEGDDIKIEALSAAVYSTWQYLDEQAEPLEGS